MFYSALHLNVSLTGRRILRDLAFDVPAASFTGIVGPNGSGKTTLLRTLSGALGYEGRLLLEGREVRDWERRALARKVAVLQQQTPVLFDFRVDDYVALGRLPHKSWLERDDAEDRRRVEAVLEELELAEMAGRTLPTLSGGERQRVFLARALVQETDALLLDEPTMHLDVYHQFELLTRIRRLTERGKTIVAVFHDLSLALRFTDQVLVLHEGRLVAGGPAHETLHAGMIRDVFRMEATLAGPAGAPTHVHYLNSTDS